LKSSSSDYIWSAMHQIRKRTASSLALRRVWASRWSARAIGGYLAGGQSTTRSPVKASYYHIPGRASFPSNALDANGLAAHRHPAATIPVSSSSTSAFIAKHTAAPPIRGRSSPFLSAKPKSSARRAHYAHHYGAIVPRRCRQPTGSTPVRY